MTLRFQNQLVSCICNGQSRNTHTRAPARANPDGLCYHYETSTPRFLVPTRTEISFYYLFLLSFCSMFGDCSKFTVLLKQKMCVSERECCLLVLDCCLLVFIGTRLVLDWYSIGTRFSNLYTNIPGPPSAKRQGSFAMTLCHDPPIPKPTCLMYL